MADELCWSKEKLTECLEGAGKHWSGGVELAGDGNGVAVVFCWREGSIGLYIDQGCEDKREE